MYDVNGMLLFAEVVRAKSFSEAARRQSLSKSQVSKAVARLEASLGVQLIRRTTRKLSLTEVGEAYFEHCERILEELSLANDMVSSHHQLPRGRLKISASVAFGTLHVAPALPDFLAQYPELSVDMTISDRLVDLAEDGYDVALRISPEPGANLVARRLAPIRRKICASPAYLARYGIPAKPAELSQHNCLDYSFMSSQGHWHLQGPDGDISVPVAGNLRINDDEALSQAVLGGLGLALLPTFIIGKDLQDGRLTEVLPGYVPTERFVYAVYLSNRHLPLKVRAFIDFLLARFGTDPYWDRAQGPAPAPWSGGAQLGLTPASGP